MRELVSPASGVFPLHVEPSPGAVGRRSHDRTREEALSDTGATRPPRVPTRITHEVLALEFLGDAGKLMLESSPSVSEVIEQLRRMLPALGLHGCQIDATLSMLTLSYWQRDLPAPLTTMRAIMVSDPRLARLTSVLTLLDEVEAGELDLKPDCGHRSRDAVACSVRSVACAPSPKWLPRRRCSSRV
jgi:Putative threonine/serine exporter